MINLSEGSLDLFKKFAYWAEWFSGNPWVEDLTKEQLGNLTDLKRKGLLTTQDYAPGESYVVFTEAGKALVAELGFATDNWHY